MNDFISIIVPVYNSSLFLKRCLSSIEMQTFKNFEVIIVDDGSTDGSAQIIDLYSEKKSQFHVFHNSNHGVSFSRNFGIEHSNGNLICFVDSDDYLDATFLEKMYKQIKNNDIVFCRFDIVSANAIDRFFETKLIHLLKNPSNIELMIVENYFYKDKNVIFTDRVFGSCCRSLFYKEIISKNNLCFKNDVKLGEDLLFMMEYLKFVKHSGFVDEYLYHYQNNENSAVKKYASNYIKNFYINRISTLKYELSFFKMKKDVFYSKYLCNYIKMLFNFAFVINEIKINPNHSSAELKKIKQRDYKMYLDFSIFKIRKITVLSFKRIALLILIKFRLYHLIGLFLRGKTNE